MGGWWVSLVKSVTTQSVKMIYYWSCAFVKDDIQLKLCIWFAAQPVNDDILLELCI